MFHKVNTIYNISYVNVLKCYILYIYLNNIRVKKKKHIAFFSKRLHNDPFLYNSKYKNINMQMIKVIKNSNLRKIVHDYLITNAFMGSVIHKSFLNYNNSYFF